MSANFVSGVSSYLLNSSPEFTSYPFTVGIWFKYRAIGTVGRTLWSLSDTGTSTHWFHVGMNASEVVVLQTNGGTTNAQATAGTVFPGRWSFAVARCSTSTDRRISHLDGNGLITHGLNTSSIAPAGVDTMAIGAISTVRGVDATFNPTWDGFIAEYWCTNSDIGPTAAHIKNQRLIKLAQEGPFAFPHIADHIVDYRGFRQVLADDQNKGDDVYWGKQLKQWKNINNTILGEHVPTTPWYPNGYPGRGLDLIKKGGLVPAAAAEVSRLRYSVRMDGIGYGGIFPGGAVHDKRRGD